MCVRLSSARVENHHCHGAWHRGRGGRPVQETRDLSPGRAAEYALHYPHGRWPGQGYRSAAGNDRFISEVPWRRFILCGERVRKAAAAFVYFMGCF